MRAYSIVSIVGVPIVAMWVIGFGVCSSGHANVAFMPGDAFFHAKLTSAVVESFPANGGKLILSYSHVPLSGGFGGYAGFEQMEIRNVPSQMTSALRGLYTELRRHHAKVVWIDVDAEGNEIAREMNGFHLFVYNRDVKWRSQVIGLKYNERWTDLPPQATLPTEGSPVRFGRSPMIMYTSFIATYSAVVEDWKNARRFHTLKVNVPKGVPWGLPGPKITQSVSVDAADIQLIICPDDDLKLYFKKKRNFEFFAVDVDGVKRFVWTKQGLVSEDYDVVP